jgi:EAL domain-containing protein (putative c-di-GMP-specific phosphodiesterase class I)
VRSCTANRTDQLVIQAVVDIARGLGKRTVAEMVGDQQTMDMLRGMGIDQVQGFHIGRPAPLAKWLVEARRAEERKAKEEQRRIAARARGPIPARAMR